ncbi:MAG TPA: anthrone oxygenase family protein [Chitinophaga sp.]|nr:anthrone oxygenase family protein [Chitinophaga sp.]
MKTLLTSTVSGIDLSLSNITLTITTTATALMAGLFFAYSCSVNPGLGRLADSPYLSAMQSINRAILNPFFLVPFVGLVLLLPFTAYLQYTSPVSPRFLLLAAATITYIWGVFGITMLKNVPLNEALDAFNIQSASIEDLARQRLQFEEPWNRWHFIRTIAAVLTSVLMILACLFPSSSKI